MFHLGNPAIGRGALNDMGCYTVMFASMIFKEKPEKVTATGYLNEKGSSNL